MQLVPLSFLHLVSKRLVINVTLAVFMDWSDIKGISPKVSDILFEEKIIDVSSCKTSVKL